jgi:hypothetical protein
MNRIMITIALLSSIGCFLPHQVSAEAPKPKAGCWSRAIASRPIGNTPALTTISGRVIAIEYNNQNQPIAAKEIATWLKLRTPAGEEKSIYLGLNQYLQQQRIKVKTGDIVEVQGAQVPKAKSQPTIVASSLKKGDRVWQIETVSDKPTNVKWCRYSG